MSKVKEYYEDNIKSLPCGRVPTRPRESHRKPQPQIEGQMSMEFDGTEISVKDPLFKNAEERAAEKKQLMLNYYDAYLDMLKKYGKLNMSANALECIDNGVMTDNVRNTLNNHYDGDIEKLRTAYHRSRYWLTKSREKFYKAAQKVDLFDVSGAYDAAYRDKERREKYRQIIKREIERIKRGKKVEVYSPEDLEAEYQVWRAARESKEKGS